MDDIERASGLGSSVPLCFTCLSPRGTDDPLMEAPVTLGGLMLNTIRYEN